MTKYYEYLGKPNDGKHKHKSMAAYPAEIKKNRKTKYPSKENQHTNYLHPFTDKLQIQMPKYYKHKQIMHGLL